jgi:hypothetical protein
MGKIKWKEVTWYSKALAIVFFIIFLLLSFSIGYWYGNLKGRESVLSLVLNKKYISGDKQELNFEYDKSNWVFYEDENYGISFLYPKELEFINPVGSWRYFLNDNSSGNLILKLKIPAIYEMNTNFVEAFFSLGISSSTLDIQKCLLPTSFEESLGSFDIGNKTFYKFKGVDKNNGHNYEVESYKTLHHNICYSIDLVVHYLDKAVLEKKYNDFNKEKIYNLLNQILETFTFTK